MQANQECWNTFICLEKEAYFWENTALGMADAKNEE
jgi:hypothetical protein